MSGAVIAFETVCPRAMVFGEAYLAIIICRSAAAMPADYILFDTVNITMTGAPIIPSEKNPPLVWTVTVQVALE